MSKSITAHTYSRILMLTLTTTAGYSRNTWSKVAGTLTKPSCNITIFLDLFGFRTIHADVSPNDVRIGQLAGCLEALHQGVTTILDHFHANNSPEHAEAVLEATIQSGARVVWAPARQSPPTELFPQIKFESDEDALKWQLEKLKEWGSKNGGKLSKDGRVILGLS